MRAGRLNTLVIFTVAGLAHELQKERDLPAVFIGNPGSSPQDVVDAPRLGSADSLGSSARLADKR